MEDAEGRFFSTFLQIYVRYEIQVFFLFFLLVYIKIFCKNHTTKIHMSQGPGVLIKFFYTKVGRV